MNSSTLRNLGIVLFALIVIILGLRLADDSDEGGIASGRLFPDLRDAVNDIDELTIEKAGESPVVIRRDAAAWVVDDRDGYPADVGKIRELLLALADAEVLEPKTSNPERYDALGVRDIDADGSAATLVTATGAGGDRRYAVLLGNSAPASGRYARIAGEPGSVLIDQNPTLPEGAGDWLVTDLIDVPAADVSEVTIAHGDGETLRVSKGARDATDFTVADIPDGRELSYPTVANGIGGALADLSLEDVRPAGEADPATVTTVSTFDGLVVTVSLFEGESEDEDAGAGAETWLALTAAAMPADDAGTVDDEEELDAETDASDDAASGSAEPADEEGPDESGGEASADDAALSADAAEESVDPQALADEINARAGGREFRVASYKANQLTRRWDDVLKALPDEEDGE